MTIQSQFGITERNAIAYGEILHPTRCPRIGARHMSTCAASSDRCGHLPDTPWLTERGNCLLMELHYFDSRRGRLRRPERYVGGRPFVSLRIFDRVPLWNQKWSGQGLSGGGEGLEGYDAVDDSLIDGRYALARFGDPETFGKINRLAEHDHRPAENAARQPAPETSGLWPPFAENPLDAVMIHRDDCDRGLCVGNRVGRAVFDNREIITAGALVEDEEVVALQKFDVFAHQPGGVAAFDGDSAQQGEDDFEKPGAKEILPGGEIDEGKGRIENIFREKSRHGDEKGVVHGLMIRDKKHPFPPAGDIASPANSGEVEWKSEKKKENGTSEDHGNVRCPDSQAGDYFRDQHDMYSLRGRP